jgi:hypothetical protein
MRNIWLALVVACLALPVLAAPKSDSHGKGQQGTEKGASSSAFTSTERDAIVSYFQAHPTAPQQLPPGIAKKVARGKPLPPGIAKKSLPQDLNAALPARAGYERVVVGSDVLLVDTATQLVADVLHSVLRK